jgi:AcrR family transcriptional regulator
MSTIAARLGGSKGTLYNYFKNKEELFAAYIEQSCARFAAESFIPALVDDQPVAEVLTRLGERYLQHIFSDWALRNLRLITAEAGRAPELARIFYRAGPAVGQERLTGYMERAKQRGAISPPDCKRAAAHFIALCRGDSHFKFILNLMDRPEPEQIQADVAAAVGMFMAAYGPSSSLPAA